MTTMPLAKSSKISQYIGKILLKNSKTALNITEFSLKIYKN